MLQPKIVAGNEHEAEGVIRALIKECADGAGDREPEALKLAAQWGLEDDWVRENFADARGLRKPKPFAELRKGRRLFDDPPGAEAKAKVGLGPQIDAALKVSGRAEPELETKPTPAVRSWSKVEVPNGATELEALTYVPGLVGDIVEWIVRGAPRPNRMMALGVALNVVGTLIGRRVQGPTKSATHLYIVILAPSSSGKDYPLHAGKALMDAVGVADLIGPDEFASTPGLWKRLKRSPLLICFIDEMGDELAKINRQGGNEWVSQLIGTLKKCYNGWEIVHTAEKAADGQESVQIIWVAVSLVGAATPEAFFAAIGPRDIESGFVNRILILPFEGCERPPEQATPEGAEMPPKSLITGLKRLPRQTVHTENLLDKPFRQGPKPPERLPPMRWGPGASEAYYAFSKKLDNLAETDPQRFELGKRGCENAVRLATNLAVGRFSPSVDLEDIGWAINFAERSIQAAVGGVENYMREYLEFPKFCARVLAKITQSGGWRSLRELKRDFRNHMKSSYELDNALRQLEAEARIIKAQRSGSRGPAADGYAVVADAD